MRQFLSSRVGLALVGFPAVVGYFLWSEHQAHVIAVLPWLLIGGGFVLISAAWRVLFEAQRRHALATTGPYAYVRHPHYAGFVLIMLGFLFQWPTLLTLSMFPILVWMYVRLARHEEREALMAFDEGYARYSRNVPAFVPAIWRNKNLPRTGGQT